MSKLRKIVMRLMVAVVVALGALSLSGCHDLEYVHEDSYVLFWRKAQPALAYKRPDNLSTFTAYIKLMFWGREPEYAATYSSNEAKYEQLCAKYGDVHFKGTRKVLTEHPAYEYTSTDLSFSAMDITIDKEVTYSGTTYAAGESLAEVTQITYTTLKRYIDNGYKGLPDADYSAITEVDDRMFLYGYEKVTKRVADLTTTDLQMVGPYARISWISKAKVPSLYNMTLTLTDEYGVKHVCELSVDPFNIEY